MRFTVATPEHVGAIIGAARRRARETGPGFASALLLHGVVVALIILLHMQIGSPPKRVAFKIVPVDVVQFGEQTTAPPALLKSVVPQQKRVPTARQDEASPLPAQ